MRQICLGLLIWIGMAHSAMAQEFIESSGKLSDDDFYKMVSCAAPLGGDCQKAVVKWSERKARKITVSVSRVDDGFPKDRQNAIRAGLDAALIELNLVPNGPNFVQTSDGSKADVQILLLDIPANSVLKDTNIKGLDGVRIQHAWVQIWWNQNNNITRSAIVFSKDLSATSAASTMLEELTQSLGFITDLRSSYYDENSIFSEDSNARTTLAPQDIMAIQRHYAN
jgi:hypothetical protein